MVNYLLETFNCINAIRSNNFTTLKEKLSDDVKLTYWNGILFSDEAFSIIENFLKETYQITILDVKLYENRISDIKFICDYMDEPIQYRIKLFWLNDKIIVINLLKND